MDASTATSHSSARPGKKKRKREAKQMVHDAVRSFWDSNYEYTTSQSEVNTLVTLNLFCQLYPDIYPHPANFISKSIEVGVRYARGLDAHFVATPISETACLHHSIPFAGEQPEQTIFDCEFHLVNIQGLITNKKNKCDSLNAMIHSTTTTKIIAVTESHLRKKQHHDAEITKYFPQYSIARADRDIEYDIEDEDQLLSHGGCLILSSPNITATPKVNFSNGNCELTITEFPQLSMSLAVFYTPPRPNFSLPKFKEAISEIRQYTQQMKTSNPHYAFTLAGDFNFPPRVVKWTKTPDGVFADFKEGNTNEKAAFQILQDTVTDLNMEQLVDKPTRKKNTLDLVFSNQPSLFSECNCEPIDTISDHKLISFGMTVNAAMATEFSCPADLPEVSKINFKRANRLKLQRALDATDWDTVLGGPAEIQNANTSFVKAITDAAMAANVPRFKSKSKNGLDENMEKLIKEKDIKLSQLLSSTLRTSDKEQIEHRINKINTDINNLTITIQDEKEKRAVSDIKSNPKAFFKYANSSRSTNSNIGPLKSGTTFQNGPKQMADILSQQYESAFSEPKTDFSDLNLKEHLCPNLSDIEITEESIREAIKDMNVSSAPGPDGVAAFFIKEYADQLVYPIMKIWRTSLDTGMLPEGTARAFITPIHKGGEKSLPANYRPVALTNHLTKIFERVLRKELVKHLELNNLMNNTQHGFRSGRSTTSQLLAYYEDVLSKLEEGHVVDSIYLDFAKAFDKVDHNVLLLKMQSLNITGKIINWCEVFLKNRQQQVKVNGVLSDPVQVKSGVPQGSVLGPLFFLILMIDINAGVLKAVLGSFADDTRVWHAISAVLEASQLQDDLNEVFHWTTANNMMLNDSKSEHMRLGCLEPDVAYTTPDGTTIVTKKLIKDLGILIEDNMLFHQHITSTVAKGMRMSGWAMRTFRTRGTLAMKTILQSLIVSLMEFGCVIWSPIDSVHINLLESVQRKFTSRFACFQTYDEALQMPICTTPYPDRLKKLKIYSLERRRERYMICYVYKIVIGLVVNPGLTFSYDSRRKIRAEPKTASRLVANWIRKARNSSFLSKAPKLYNTIPSNLRELEDISNPSKKHVNSFKNKLDRHLASIPDIPGTRHNSLLEH